MCTYIFGKPSKWKTNSYIKPIIAQSAIISKLAEFQIISGSAVTGLIRQPWWLFAPDPVKDMGSICIYGQSPDNETINLLTNEVVQIKTDETKGQPVLDPPPYNNFTRGRFVLSFYARKYINTWPQTLFEEWTRYEYKRWKKAHPHDRLLQVSMMYYSNDTSLRQNDLVRRKNLITLYNYKPTD